MSVWAWSLQLVLVVLLAATLFYALRLERSIGMLRSDRAGLGNALAAIRAALDDAERGIQALQGMAEGTARRLTLEVEAAGQAQHDLQFLLDRVESVAAKVESVIRSGRAIVSLKNRNRARRSTARPSATC